MENATKALMIAAAVIVAILLISLGIGVFNMGQEQTQNADLTEYQIQQFNDKFKNYEGTKMRGAEVNALLDTVFNHNNSQDSVDTCVEVPNYPAEDGTNAKVEKKPGLTASPKKVTTSATFKVVLAYDAKTGLVNKATITKN